MDEVTVNAILEHSDDPQGLETLYRRAPEAFRQSLAVARRERPDSVVLRVWQARFDYDQRDDARAWRQRLLPAIVIALVFGAFVRLPAIWLSEDWYYPRLAPSLALLALACYFWIQHRDRTRLITGLALTFASIVYVSLLPGFDDSDSALMALMHLPVVFWAFLGLVFTGDAWRQTDVRIRFIRYNGELVVLGSLVALGGLVFSGLTVALFELMFEGIDELYFENAGIFGAVAVPIAGTFLYDVIFNRRTAIASVLARIFAPLFLVMAVTYLIVALIGGQNPFVDRDFLITFNGLLLVVLGITVFSIVERGEDASVRWMDHINLSLAIVTLLIDAIALSAILFRLASYGFTPNRVIVLGANLVIMVHLAWMCWTYVLLVRQKVDSDAMRRVVARYLPVYAVWAAVVAFLLPLVFGYA